MFHSTTWWFRAKTCLLSFRYFEQTISLSAPTSFVSFNLETFTTNTALVRNKINISNFSPKKFRSELLPDFSVFLWHSLTLLSFFLPWFYFVWWLIFVVYSILMFQSVLMILCRLTLSGLEDFLCTFLPKMFVKFLNFGWVNSNFCPWELFIFSLRSLAPLLPSFSLFLPAEPLLSRPPLAPSLSEISFSCTLLVQSNTGASPE